MSLQEVLSGKSILFIAPKFFGYENKIIERMMLYGANVTYVQDNPFRSKILKALLRLFPSLMYPFCNFIFRMRIKKFLFKPDIVFVIKGEGLSPKLISWLRAKHRNAKFILYLWDSIRNVPKTHDKLSLFDEFKTFDPEDALMFGIPYRPLFYVDDYKQSNPKALANEKNVNVFFVGTLHGDRAAVIKRIADIFPKEVNLNINLYIRSKLEFLIRKIFDASIRNLNEGWILKHPLSSNQIKVLFEKSDVILDVEHPSQSGLTIRVFEVLASGKKIITTNTSIKKHDFFDPTRVCVIERMSPFVPMDFFYSEFKSLSDDFKKTYSIDGWLFEILGMQLDKE